MKPRKQVFYKSSQFFKVNAIVALLSLPIDRQTVRFWQFLSSLALAVVLFVEYIHSCGYESNVTL